MSVINTKRAATYWSGVIGSLSKQLPLLGHLVCRSGGCAMSKDLGMPMFECVNCDQMASIRDFLRLMVSKVSNMGHEMSNSNLDKVGAVVVCPNTGRFAMGWNYNTADINGSCELPSGQTSSHVRHAEHSAIDNFECGRKHIHDKVTGFNEVGGAWVFVKRRPCKSCVELMINLKIDTVVFINPQPDMEHIWDTMVDIRYIWAGGQYPIILKLSNKDLVEEMFTKYMEVNDVKAN